ncbi:c-Myc-binding protein-like [Quillaja saponaria]|uniref:c-Myc-binding protein-like n=1 Tax=Quillaja saponaria TaxID=32244 RepID=A0AAD7VJN6_QUISA|nr:c-Myc-binding protein-like [Quillaja saponaria]
MLRCHCSVPDHRPHFFSLPASAPSQGFEEKKIMMRYKEEKEAKKEAFRKYLESSGAVDALTKVLVALYEQNDKPSSALEFIQQKIGGPSASDYERLQAEFSDLQVRYNDLLAAHQETCKELEEIKNSDPMVVAYSKEPTDGESPKSKNED